MSTTQDRAAVPPPWPRLPLGGRVDRSLIHRRNPGEAFLVNAMRTGPDRFTAAALLPPAHPHYGEHTGPSRALDPLLLLECARQAETYAAHTMFGVERGAHFVLRAWSAQFDAVPPGADGAPGELLLTARTSSPRMVGDRLRGLDFDFELLAAGTRVGRVWMDVGYVSAAAYPVLRGRGRVGPPPSSDALVPAAGRPAAPDRVGRLRPTDVVLLDVVSGARACTARLRVPVENPSLFDHAQDHVPAMVLMEAARQLAVLVVGERVGAGPERTRLAALDATFERYAELDGPVLLTAEPATDTPSGWRVDLRFRQADADVACARTVVAVPAAATGEEASWSAQRS